jgi:hypothetical protein
MTSIHRTRWFLPLFSVGLGLAFFVALWLGDESGSAWLSLALMTGLRRVFLLDGRHDMVRGLRGDGLDEYWGRMDVHATAIAGQVVIFAIIATCLWEFAHGQPARRTCNWGRLPAWRTLPRSRCSGSGAEQRLERRVARRSRRPDLAPGALARVLVRAEADELRPVPEAVRLHLVVAHLDDELRTHR